MSCKQSDFNIKIMPKNEQNILLHSALVLPDKTVFSLIFCCLKLKWLPTFMKISNILLRLFPLKFFKYCPPKYIKVFSSDFIFRKQKIFLETRIVRLDSGLYTLKYKLLYFEFRKFMTPLCLERGSI